MFLASFSCVRVMLNFVIHPCLNFIYMTFFFCLGCHLYALSRPGSSFLRLVAALGKRLLVMMWKHSSAWSAWCPVSDNDTVDGFQFLRVRLLECLDGVIQIGCLERFDCVFI